eukprot:c1868_g1_i1.p1 GENE.c1868_g1_i1~~c1868_g1_i1.p1  ORF type:complete len:515 (+),score=124.03 c1868_g1_i1:60-1547(+)
MTGPTKRFAVVAAVLADTLGIGKDGGLPWKAIPIDMQHFKAITTGKGRRNAVIMGRKTWESIPEKFRPLQDRLNVIVSRSPMSLNVPAGVLSFSSFDSALQLLSAVPNVDEVFVIGGGDMYREAVNHHSCARLELTFVEKINEKCDVFFPAIDPSAWKCVSQSEKQVDEKSGVEFTFKSFERYNNINNATTTCEMQHQPQQPTAQPNHEEMQYLDLIRKILNEGATRTDRTGTGTISIFGAQMRFSLRDESLPLLTTKKVFWRGVAEELLWFVSGSTDATMLQRKNIHIWDGNSSREFLDKLGFTNRVEGDLGPVYGFQWRHFGAAYDNKDSDYTLQGVDQLKQCIDVIKTNPCDRRIVMTAWNPSDLGKMVLPPCHMFCQFYVANGELSCQMYQRSADMGLGVPFNIASYALLTRLMAQVCGLKAGDFVHTIGDAHIYLNHVDALRQQLDRSPRPFPKLKINPAKTLDIDAFEFADLEVIGYDPHGSIKMDMAV